MLPGGLRIGPGSNDTNFRDYGRPLTNMAFFKYLGRLLTATDYNWPAVVTNLRKAWRKWDWISWILV